MTPLTTIGGHTLPNPVRVPDNLMAPTILRPLMEGVRATLPPSTLFADSVLPHKGYTISMPKA